MGNRQVLILGGGINGAATARELTARGVDCWLVDRWDLASGTTAASSRLIHGGLRYLEHAELSLVRESLRERNYWLRTAPHLVQPLSIFIPVASRSGGLLRTIARWCGLPVREKQRGLWLIRSGLWLYDQYARYQSSSGADIELARHAVHQAGKEALPEVASQFRWLCEYPDAQLLWPERLVIDLLMQAREHAERQGCELRVLTYHSARRVGKQIEILNEAGETVLKAAPDAVVNACGAWIDESLEQLQTEVPRQIGGTKGSHLVSFDPELRRELDAGGVYAEAEDGRPVFILPLGTAVLIGTTDRPFDGPPGSAIADEEEIDYLLNAVAGVFPQHALKRDAIELAYSGVRPLPYVGSRRAATITRRHHVALQQGPWPIFSLIGGKLTTAHALAVELTRQLFEQFGTAHCEVDATLVRPSPDARPSQPDARVAAAASLGRTWSATGDVEADRTVHGTALPRSLVRQVIREEWVQRLGDLVERRLMLLYHPRVDEAMLRELADLLAEVRDVNVELEVEHCIERLGRRYRKAVVRGELPGGR